MLIKKKLSMYEILILLSIGLVAGILSGVVGIGGGVIIVPALVLLLNFSQHGAQGTTLAMMVPPIGILAVLEYYRQGHVDLRIAGILCVGFIFGALIGSKVAIGLPEVTLKKVFGVIIMLIAVKMVFWK